MEAKDRKCLRCDQPGHRAAQCKSGLPLKEIGAEEGEEFDYTLMICPEGDGWTVVEDGRIKALTFEHQTSFHFFDDDSEDDDGEDVAYNLPYTLEVNAAGEPEDENEQYDEHPSCGMECHARGLPRIAAMLKEMGRPWIQDERESTVPQESSFDAPEDPVLAPTHVCGSASEIGSCKSMCSLAHRVQGRFRRARRTESPRSSQMIEKESPDGPQDRNKVFEFEGVCEGNVDATYRAISELLRSLEDPDKLENETNESSNEAGGITKAHVDKAVQIEAKAEDPAEELKEDAADDDVDYRKLFCEFQWSLRTELLSDTQPNVEQDASHLKILYEFQCGFNTEPLDDDEDGKSENE